MKPTLARVFIATITVTWGACDWPIDDEAPESGAGLEAPATDETIPTGESGDEPIEVDLNTRVCGIDRFSAADGTLSYRENRTYLREGDLVIIDRDNDGDGADDEQYRYTSVDGSTSSIALDRDLDGRADFLRIYVYNDEDKVDYYLQDTGTSVGGWQLTLGWNWLGEYLYDDTTGFRSGLRQDNSPDQDFEPSDYLYRTTDIRDSQGQLLEQVRENSTLEGVDYHLELTRDENGRAIKQSIDHVSAELVDGVVDQTESYLYDDKGRVIQVDHDLDGNGTTDLIERRSYDGC